MGTLSVYPPPTWEWWGACGHKVRQLNLPSMASLVQGWATGRANRLGRWGVLALWTLRYSELTLHMKWANFWARLVMKTSRDNWMSSIPLPSEIDIVNNAEQVALFEDIGLGMKHNHSSPSFAFGKFNINECKSVSLRTNNVTIRHGTKCCHMHLAPEEYLLWPHGSTS